MANAASLRHIPTMLEDHRTTQDPLKPHAPPADEQQDAAEIWGKRIGRTLGFAFALYLIYALLVNYVWK